MFIDRNTGVNAVGKFYLSLKMIFFKKIFLLPGNRYCSFQESWNFFPNILFKVAWKINKLIMLIFSIRVSYAIQFSFWCCLKFSIDGLFYQLHCFLYDYYPIWQNVTDWGIFLMQVFITYIINFPNLLETASI